MERYVATKRFVIESLSIQYYTVIDALFFFFYEDYIIEGKGRLLGSNFKNIMLERYLWLLKLRGNVELCKY